MFPPVANIYFVPKIGQPILIWNFGILLLSKLCQNLIYYRTGMNMASPSQKNETQTRGGKKNWREKSSLHKKLRFSNLKRALCTQDGKATITQGCPGSVHSYLNGSSDWRLESSINFLFLLLSTSKKTGSLKQTTLFGGGKIFCSRSQEIWRWPADG